MKKGYIAVSEVASALGKRKQSIFKIIKRLGIEKRFEKSDAAGGQKIAYISGGDFEIVKEHVQSSGKTSSIPFLDSASGGVFYLIRLEPEHDPTRFKLGFTSNIDERLRSHRTVAPYSKVIKTWPCKPLWEKTAIESIARGCEKVHTEVFRGEVEVILDRCEQFFMLMPPLADGMTN